MRGFAEPVCLCVCYQGSRRSDEEALEEQVRKLGEELRELRELYEAEQDKSRSGEDELLQLHNQVPTVAHTHTQTAPAERACLSHLTHVLLLCDPQVALLSVETCSLREDNERMKTMAEIREPSEQLQSAIRDRDDAIAKYGHTVTIHLLLPPLCHEPTWRSLVDTSLDCL